MEDLVTQLILPTDLESLKVEARKRHKETGVNLAILDNGRRLRIFPLDITPRHLKTFLRIAQIRWAIVRGEYPSSMNGREKDSLVKFYYQKYNE